MDIHPGDLVFLTAAYDRFMRSRHLAIATSFTNRIAKLEEIIDWDSEKGKIIKQARIKSGKWKDLPLEDNRYIFSIFYHELPGKNGKLGVIERGVPLFSKDPVSGAPFFEKMPDWIFVEISKQCLKFEVELKENVS